MEREPDFTTQPESNALLTEDDDEQRPAEKQSQRLHSLNVLTARYVVDDGHERELSIEERKSLLKETRSLRDGEIDLLLQESEDDPPVAAGEKPTIDDLRRAALVQEADRRGRVAEALEGKDTIEQIRENLWLLRKPGSQNPVSVIFREGDRLIVTDPGVSWASRGKNKNLEELKTALGAQIDGIFLTHSHPDHIGDIPNIATPETPIFLHPKAFWSMRSPKTLMKAERVLTRPKPHFPKWQEMIYGAYARLAYGPGISGAKKRRPEGGEQRPADEWQYQEFPEDSFSFDGYTVEVIHTPGHTRGEVSFWIPEERILIGGDLVPNTHVGRDHIPSLYMPECDIYEALDSLKRMRDLKPRLFIPAHGEPIRSEQEIEERLENMIGMLERIIQRVNDLHQANPNLTYDELSEELFNTPEFPQSSKFGAIEKKSIVHTVLRDAQRGQHRQEKGKE